jgi:hypothetical protein
MSSGAGVAFAVLILAGVVDALLTQPFFGSLLAGNSYDGWSPVTYVLFVYGIPYAASAAAVTAAIGAIATAFRRG